MNVRTRAKRIIEVLSAWRPKATTELRYDTPFQLLVAVILSAQCTDARVNQVTPALFKEFPSPQKMALAPLRRLEQLVHSTGFFRSKAKHIRGAAKLIVQKFDGRVPDSMKELMELPGVARKTANVVLWHAFGKAEGIAVDTHVRRLANRLKLSSKKNTDQIERDLLSVFDSADWGKVNMLLVLHGRYTCTARKPNCRECVVAQYCPSRSLFLPAPLKGQR